MAYCLSVTQQRSLSEGLPRKRRPHRLPSVLCWKNIARRNPWMIFLKQEEKRKFLRMKKSIARQAKKGKKSTQLARVWPKNRENSTSDHRTKGVKTIPRLTEDHKARRVQYAHEMANANWKQVLFTDEKSFWLETTDTHAWQERGKRKTVKKSRWVKKLHVWGGIGYFYKTNLHCFEANMNAELYQSILRKNLPPDHAPDCPARMRSSGSFCRTTIQSIPLLDRLPCYKI